MQRALQPLAFTLSYTMPLMLCVGLLYGGWSYFLVPFFVFGLLPVFDYAIGTYTYNADDDSRSALLADRRFKWVGRAFVPVQVLLVVGGAFWCAQGGLTRLEQTGLLLSVALCTGGTGITLAHEFSHQPKGPERWLSKLLLLCVCYMHFFIEHLRGHHRRVGTPEDPASARYNESFYAFYARSLVGSWLSAWQLEATRLRKLKLPVLHWRNQMLWFTALPLLLTLMLGLLWGPVASAFFLLQSLIAFSLLEAVNYIEHYGLSRQRLRPGVYEKVEIHHSWNSNFLLTNCLLFMLQRHSDHHAHQSRPYAVLRQFDESPQLPAGYPTMILLALIPPLWKRVMHPRVNAYNTHQQRV
jgi:alkane 1-monooxygenase